MSDQLDKDEHVYYDPDYCEWRIRSPYGTRPFRYESTSNAYDWMQGDLPMGSGQQSLTAVCEHDWRIYNDGFKAYRYCEKCNAPKEKI